MSEIYVTRPHLPPLDDVLPLLQEIWASRILTNVGPFHRQFETKLADFLGTPELSLVSNGTIAISLALKAAGIDNGEVVTTPFSFVATAHSILWEGLTPVFADVRESDLNIDPEAVEAAITPQTKAILAVHCYGNPCAVAALEEIASRHGLAVIYDAAHAFGVEYKGRPLVSWGDFSTLSFHATKVFNTFEGGAVIARNPAGKTAIDRLRNFGIVDELTVESVGGNAKMNEFNAAMGLLQLDWFDHCRAQRARVDRAYREHFSATNRIACLPIPADCKPNYSYFPVLVGDGEDGLREKVLLALRGNGIHARRYFYPLLANLPMYRGAASSAPANLPVANLAAERVLCLPIYPDLADDDVDRIAETILEAAR